MIVSEPVAAVEPTPVVKPRWWKRWLVRLAVFACTFWLLLVTAHRVLSGRAYWWGPIDLLPPLAFAAVPVALFVVALLARPVRWRLSAVVAVALVLGIGYSGINFATLWYSPPAAPTDAIKLITWNTEYWDQDLEGGAPRSTEDFYAFLRRHDADVYMLQEYAHVDFTLADTASQALAIDQEAQLRAAFPGYEIVIAGRDITLSRLPVLGHRWLDSTTFLPEEFKAVPAGLRERPLFYQSQTLRTDIRVNGQVVSFYNSHIYQPPQRIFRLRNDPDRSMFDIDRFNFEIRRASYRAIAADMAQNTNRIVMGGDLNTSPSMGILSMIPDRLVDQTRALSSIYPVTWPATNRAWRLDWLFTTPDIEVSSYDLLEPAGLSDHKVQQVLLSAH
ncbi:endonuclease/exonuclease/phosphatase (EEP) superfamily protein YafD [Allocatelliglobosispora scoriae]|uniref:Endonuclease/exonuclease/phosphatase (EEP) superfamily protein YafD n=1 Tax=Allocatelliglobosispora scoriae TaxID=643052 RepID=A0A841BXK6_9ACTN|nr:endonuclease/exonuclease/phosphatase family protein [Allocatelliglobosispora scoriae]MBB5871450.1 endonuclease/exonuclease/phosphatase (EEP) superfamily protein YafD [Allocatelliglobosispora scoriae]